MNISIIVAMANNQVIGRNNQLPWHMPADLKHFKALTTGKPIIMGRKTYESIGRPLPNRRNIVITRQTDWQAAGCEVVHSLQAALMLVKDCAEVMIIGGGIIFQEALPIANRLYLTLIHHDFVGDAYFPALNSDEWHETDRIDSAADDANPYAYSFITLERQHYSK
ncbi:MAG: dihydrofolate reductase [Coxiellaceae bacterium]|nr:MAG: dihydrofolate reductase [Coxiellaceae bacterium]